MTPNIAPRPDRSYRLILVEDNADLARGQCLLLSKHGHEAKWAASAAEALNLLESFIPDAMIIDLGLPVVDGYDLALRIRKNDRLPRFPLIAQSGYADESHKQHAADNGFDHYLTKPVPWRTLSDLLESLLPVDAS